MSYEDKNGKVLVVASKKDQFANELIKVIDNNRISVLRSPVSLVKLDKDIDAVLILYDSCCVSDIDFVVWADIVRERRKKKKKIFLATVTAKGERVKELLKASGADFVISAPKVKTDTVAETALKFYKKLGKISPFFIFNPRMTKTEESKSEGQAPH